MFFNKENIFSLKSKGYKKPIQIALVMANN